MSQGLLSYIECMCFRPIEEWALPENQEPCRKLIERLVSYAREQRYHKIILNTTGSHKAALGFYKKSGFELIKVLPFEQKLPTDIELNYFELHLY